MRFMCSVQKLNLPVASWLSPLTKAARTLAACHLCATRAHRSSKSPTPPVAHWLLAVLQSPRINPACSWQPGAPVLSIFINASQRSLWMFQLFGCTCRRTGGSLSFPTCFMASSDVNRFILFLCNAVFFLFFSQPQNHKKPAEHWLAFL